MLCGLCQALASTLTMYDIYVNIDNETIFKWIELKRNRNDGAYFVASVIYFEIYVYLNTNETEQ